MKYPIFLDSLPKSGTHLLAKALTGLSGVDHSGRHMDRKTIAEFVDKGVEFSLEGREDINIERDYQWIERLLISIPSGRFLTVHLNYHPKVHNALQQMNYKLLLMIVFNIHRIRQPDNPRCTLLQTNTSFDFSG